LNDEVKNQSIFDIPCSIFNIPFLTFAPMFKMLLYIFLFYLLYKFVFELLIPVSKATSQVKDKLREMQEQQQAQQRQQQESAPSQQAQAKAGKEPGTKGGDYIEFEEVK